MFKYFIFLVLILNLSKSFAFEVDCAVYTSSKKCRLGKKLNDEDFMNLVLKMKNKHCRRSENSKCKNKVQPCLYEACKIWQKNLR